MAAAGSANLPLSGNAENFNQLLHATEYTTLAVRLRDTAEFDLTGVCRGSEAARHLEESVRAMVTLGAAGTSRQPAVSSLLRRIRITRDDRVVHLTVGLRADELQTVLELFATG